MKELENNWMKKWESVKEKTVCIFYEEGGAPATGAPLFDITNHPLLVF